MKPNSAPNSLRFDPFTGDISRGSFVIEAQDLRDAFGTVGAGGLVYGCQSFAPAGKLSHIRLVDPERYAIERVCEQYGKGNVELRDFQEITKSGTGFVLNSLQDPRKPKGWGFNKLAHSFLENSGQAPNCCAEEIDVVAFFGTYDAGFGIHKDAYDTAMYVLDGRKHFLIEVNGERKKYTLEAGEYIRWRSLYAHTNCNPEGSWSMTLNFTLGPSALRLTPAGTPVDYVHPTTELKNLLTSLYVGVGRKL